ncbi:MAG TPA: tetratricopeptide repeat protein, partial [Pontiella sp.]|nr:tetratricopeptide repeat protein [Pontiella sp.]
IWIPTPQDSNLAFQMYIKNDGAGADVSGGKVQVQGVAAVMKINGYLSQMIFDHNQYRTETRTDEKTRPVGAAVVYDDPVIDPETGLPPLRTFYVEESYVLEWMYPYLTPHGLIMKINNEPTPLTEEIIKNDTDFWNWYIKRLLNDRKFMRDIVARKTFSKLRSSIASLYAARGRANEAEAAFRQAIALYDLSPEANYRLTDLLTRRGRSDEALEIFEAFLEKDSNNEQAKQFRDQMVQRKEMSQRIQVLEQQLNSGKSNFNQAMQLCSIYYSMGQIRKADALMIRLVEADSTSAEEIMQLVQMAVSKQRFGVIEKALEKFIVLRPSDPNGWINLAALQLSMNKRGEMWVSLQKAIDVGGDYTRNLLLQDTRFNPVRNSEQFKSMLPVQPGRVDIGVLPGY